MADVLKEHIEQCPDHPMSALKRENEELKRRRVADSTAGPAGTFFEVQDSPGEVLFEMVTGPPENIRFCLGGRTVMEITSDGFFIEGRPLDVGDIEEHRTIYKTFKAWVLSIVKKT
jgi:hypothetical protein